MHPSADGAEPRSSHHAAAPPSGALVGAHSIDAVAAAVARALEAKKAEDIEVLRVEDLLQICAYFVVVSGGSSRHLITLAETAGEILDAQGLKRIGAGGLKGESRWICLDYGEIVVHIFSREAREFYAIDHLWGDAPRLKLELDQGSA